MLYGRVHAGGRPTEPSLPGGIMLLSLILLLGAAAGVPADNLVKDYPGGWKLSQGKDNCLLVRSYSIDSNDIIWGISYYPRANMVRVQVIDDRLKDIVDGGYYKFELHFVNGNALDKRWDAPGFQGVKYPDVGSGYQTYVVGKTFLAELGKNGAMGITNGANVVEVLPLDSLSDALAGLEACSPSVR
jgi:hypothetical protein